jgi:hypothetical protein
MQKLASDTAQDARIATLITRVSTKIMRDYGREFVPGGPLGLPASGATRTLSYSWVDQYPTEAWVSLAPYDLQLTPDPVIQVDTDQASPITLSADEWRLRPQPPRDGVYTAIYLSPLNVTVGTVGWRKRQLKITGNWGFPAIPGEVAEAAAQTVAYWITAFPAAGRPDLGDMIPPQPRGYPMSALDLLSPFKRMDV